MIKKILQKKLFTTCLITIFTISLLPLTSSNAQHTDDITILILNNTHGSLEKNEIILSPEAANTLIQELMKNEMTPSNYKQEIRKKLTFITRYRSHFTRNRRHDNTQFEYRTNTIFSPKPSIKTRNIF